MTPGAICLGDLRIRPPIFQAPMVGVTHSAFRRLLAGLGGVGLFSTEMLSARSLPFEDPRNSPYLIRAAEETPLSYQVLLAAPSEVGPAFDALHALGPDAIDLNLGCPAPAVRKRGAGSRLMEKPEVARAVVAEARRRTRLPLLAKIRLGESLDEEHLREFSRMIEGEGVDLVTVHARLRREPYGRKPRWDWIGKVKSWVSIPVVANGGIFSTDDARRCLIMTGCDGIMVGRGAAVRPWLTAAIARELYSVKVPSPAASRPVLYQRFVDLLEEGFPVERQLGRLKEFTHYFSRTYPFGHELAVAVQKSRSVREACERAEGFFSRNDSAGGSDGEGS